MLIQHLVFLVFSKEKSKLQLKDNLISIIVASIFFGIMFSLVSIISHQFNYIIISFILMASIISTYWFIINPLKYMLHTKKYFRDLGLEQEMKSEGYNYKILFSNKISTNAYATGIIPFYKIIIVGENLKNKLSKTQLKAILYHEIGHHENKHLLKLFFINVVLQTFFFIMFFEIYQLHIKKPLIEPLLVATTGGLIGFIFYIIPNKIAYLMEYQADRFAVKNYNKNDMINALKKLDEISGEKLTKGNINHPNLEKRIENIEKYEKS